MVAQITAQMVALGLAVRRETGQGRAMSWADTRARLGRLHLVVYI